ncbi:hypothetical protein BN165_1070022 [Clostridioides difficile E1]|nr:hypothetical protein BN164_1890001 [Clostridioides difficile T20]CCK94359.1 hypothetical protein BN165_1070022 [Clostridioides difficile E1]
MVCKDTGTGVGTEKNASFYINYVVCKGCITSVIIFSKITLYIN